MSSLFCSFYNKFGIPGVVGVIDGTHVAIVGPSVHEERFVNRKGFHSLNVMIICDSNLNVLCVDASLPGNTHDATVWQNPALPAFNGVREFKRANFSARCLLAARVLHYDPIIAGKIVNACCALHNIANTHRVPVDPLSAEEGAAEAEFNRRVEAEQQLRSEAVTALNTQTQNRSRVNSDLLRGRALQ